MPRELYSEICSDFLRLEDGQTSKYVMVDNLEIDIEKTKPYAIRVYYDLFMPVRIDSTFNPWRDAKIAYAASKICSHVLPSDIIDIILEYCGYATYDFKFISLIHEDCKQYLLPEIRNIIIEYGRKEMFNITLGTQSCIFKTIPIYDLPHFDLPKEPIPMGERIYSFNYFKADTPDGVNIRMTIKGGRMCDRNGKLKVVKNRYLREWNAKIEDGILLPIDV